MTRPSEALELLQRVYDDEKGLRFGSVEFTCTLAVGQAGYPDFAGIGLDFDFGLELDDEGLRVKDIFPSLRVLNIESAPPAELVSTYLCGAPSALVDRSPLVVHRGDILRGIGDFPVANASDHHKSVIKKVMLAKFKNMAASSHAMSEESTTSVDRTSLGVRCTFMRVLSCQDALEHFDVLKHLRNVKLCEQTMDSLRNRLTENSALTNALLSIINTDTDDVQRVDSTPNDSIAESIDVGDDFDLVGPEDKAPSAIGSGQAERGEDLGVTSASTEWSPPYLISRAASANEGGEAAATLDAEYSGTSKGGNDGARSKRKGEKSDDKKKYLVRVLEAPIEDVKEIEIYVNNIVTKAESIAFARISAGVAFECIPHLLSSALSEAKVKRTPKTRTPSMKVAAVVGSLSDVGSRVLSKYSAGTQFMIVFVIGLLFLKFVIAALTMVSTAAFGLSAQRWEGNDFEAESYWRAAEYQGATAGSAASAPLHDGAAYSASASSRSSSNRGSGLEGVRTPDIFFPRELQDDLRKFGGANKKKNQWRS